MAGPDDGEDSEQDDGPPRREGPPDERVLAPEELDFTEDEKVEQLDEGKFVIGTDSEPSVPPDERSEPQGSEPQRSQPRSSEPQRSQPRSSEPQRSQPQTASEGATPDSKAEPASSPSGAGPGQTAGEDTGTSRTAPEGSTGTSSGLSGREVKEFLSTELRRTESKYAYRIAAKTDDTVSHQQLASDDIGMAFDGLLMWYAQQVGADTSVEEALGILLAKSNIRIRYPTKLLAAYLRKQDLGPGDDIADLMAAIRQEDGLVFPPDTG